MSATTDVGLRHVTCVDLTAGGMYFPTLHLELDLITCFCQKDISVHDPC